MRPVRAPPSRRSQQLPRCASGDKVFTVDISAWGTKDKAKVLFGNSFTGGGVIQLLFQNYERFMGQGQHQYEYRDDENLWYFSSDSGVTWTSRQVLILSDDCSITSGAINSLDAKLPFRAVDYSDSSWVAEQAMPSDKYIDLTFGASGTVYTAPANGYFRFLQASKGTAKLTYLTAGIQETGITARDSSYLANTTSSYSNQVFIMAKKGQHVVLGYDAAATVTNSLARFVYCEGE